MRFDDEEEAKTIRDKIYLIARNSRESDYGAHDFNRGLASFANCIVSHMRRQVIAQFYPDAISQWAGVPILSRVNNIEAYCIAKRCRQEYKDNRYKQFVMDNNGRFYCPVCGSQYQYIEEWEFFYLVKINNA